MKVTRKNIGHYQVTVGDRKFEIMQSEDKKVWQLGEFLENGYGFEGEKFLACDNYTESFETFRECKQYIRGIV